MKYLVVFLTVLALIGAGCAQVGGVFSDTPSSQQAIAKLAIQYATLKAVKNDPARAAGVADIVDQALDALGDDPVISAEELQAELFNVLPENLAPEDKLLASSLITLVVQELEERLTGDQIDLPLTEVSAVLGWVQEAAALVAEPSPLG